MKSFRESITFLVELKEEFNDEKFGVDYSVTYVISEERRRMCNNIVYV